MANFGRQPKILAGPIIKYLGSFVGSGKSIEQRAASEMAEILQIMVFVDPMQYYLIFRSVIESKIAPVRSAITRLASRFTDKAVFRVDVPEELEALIVQIADEACPNTPAFGHAVAEINKFAQVSTPPKIIGIGQCYKHPDGPRTEYAV